MNTTWRLSSYESMTDVKELIPEFFYLPEFLINREGTPPVSPWTRRRITALLRRQASILGFGKTERG